MVRIVKEHTEEPTTAMELSAQGLVLLQVLGVMIADRPQVISTLLQTYGLDISDHPSDQELLEGLLSGIEERDADFNHDLAVLILDGYLDADYESYEGADAAADASGVLNSTATGASSGGLIGGITGAIGGIGSALGAGFGRKQAKEQATMQAVQGMMSYRQQTAQDQVNYKARQKKKQSLWLVLFMVIGACLLVLLAKTKPRQPVPLLNA